MTRLRLHAACAAWALAGALTGCAVAFAQDPGAVPVVADPTADLLLRLLQGGGLPVIAAYVAYRLRDVLAGGITVRIHPDDLAVLRGLRDPKRE